MFCYNHPPNTFDLYGLDDYADYTNCVRNCELAEQDRNRSVDQCAKWGAGIYGGIGALLGAVSSAGKGRALSGGAVLGAAIAAAAGAVIEIGGRAGTLALLHICEQKCASAYLPQPTTWPMTADPGTP
jgi:hypothetical protein